jgi:type I restriction enzyme M protein
MPRDRSSTKKEESDNGRALEAKLWQAADALRANMDAAEYKHVVLGLIFLKYISDAFEAKHAELECQKAQGADPEDPDEYRAASIFWVPKEARWSLLKASAPQPTIGKLVDDAMEAIERDNPTLKGVLPKDYARPGLDKERLGQLINLVSDIDLRRPSPQPYGHPSPIGRGEGSEGERATDVLGRVYEYFLAQFASAEGKKGGQFYTPSHVVRVLVAMLAPYKGRVYDPCCGSGGMFVQSEKFIEAHAGKIGDISIYGQESNYTTWRLAKMNLALRGIDAQIAHGDTFHNDKHPDLKADYVLANPPFNDSDWRGELLKDDKRWVYGTPPAGNANFAWVQHFIHHLAPSGIAGFVLANGSMSSNQSGEGKIREAIIEADLVDCMVALPGQLFYSTQIPVCLWFIARDKRGQPSPATPLPAGEGHYRGGFDFSGQLKLARELRQRATPAEAFAWELLCDRRFLGLKFRRQHQIGDYVVDFHCDEKNLVVELDGPVHGTSERQEVDHKRDAYLKALGLTVLRIPNQHLLDQTEETLREIAQAITTSAFGRGVGEGASEVLHTSSPLGRGTRGEGEPAQTRDRRGEVLFIDARKMGRLVDRVHRELTDGDAAKIAGTYHLWRGDPHPASSHPLPTGEGQGQGASEVLHSSSPSGRGGGEGASEVLRSSSLSGRGGGEGDIYEDVLGFCKSATIEEVRRHGHVLTPGRYVGAEAAEDDGEPFDGKMKRLTATLREQQAEAAKLDEAIAKNLEELGFWEDVR